jgi:hypothetical protein
MTTNERARRSRRSTWLMSDTWVRIGGLQGKLLPDGKHAVLLPTKGTRCIVLHCPTGKTYPVPNFGSIADSMRAAYDWLVAPDGEQAGIWRDAAGRPLRSDMSVQDHSRADGRKAREAAAREAAARVQVGRSAVCSAALAASYPQGDMQSLEHRTRLPASRCS